MKTIRFSSRGRKIFRLFILILVVFPFFFLFTTREAAGAGRDYSMPVSGKVLRGFEKPSGPYGEGGHQGIDIAAARGTQVKAAGEGVVAWVGEVPRGRFVSIEHPSGTRTTYLDLERVQVSRGERVRRGQSIGTVSGSRDDSSKRPHLHFGAYVNGHPVDPHLLLGGFDFDSFIRLCPVENPGVSDSWQNVDEGAEGGFLSWIGKGFKWIASPFKSSWHAFKKGFSLAWEGIKVAARSVGEFFSRIWSKYVFPALRSVGKAILKALKWVWSNRWIQAIVAGLAAALVVVAGIALAVLTLGLSLVVAAVAAVVGAVAAIGVAIYYAASHGDNFNFLGCFATSLGAGAIGAGMVATAGSLSGVFSAGWAKLGLWGITKAAFWNGVGSALFEVSTSLLFKGHFSWKEVLAAFGLGIVTGAVGRVLKLGITPLRIGSRIAFIFFGGTFGVTVNSILCCLTGKPITLSSCLASFLTGSAMAGVALSFGARGLEGLLGKFRVFKEGLGRMLRGMVSRVLEKGLKKGSNQGLEKGFKRVLGEEDISP